MDADLQNILYIALVAMLAVFTVSFVLISFFAVKALILFNKLLADLKAGTAIVKGVKYGTQSAATILLDGLINVVRRR